jgi:hypothetical protein
MSRHLSALHLQTLHPSLEPVKLMASADAQLDMALSIPSYALDPAHASFLETSVGVHTIAILRMLRDSQSPAQSDRGTSKSSLSTRNLPFYTQSIKVVVDMTKSDDDGLQRSRKVDDGGSEILYGRAGTLYAILLLRSAMNAQGDASVTAGLRPLVDDTTIRTLVSSIILRGKAGSVLYAADSPQKHPPALMWSWHGKRYLGAAHGVGGFF